jgi:hypothetical protein
MLKFFENSNFLPTKSDKLMISVLFSTVLNMRPYFFETIFSRGFWDMSLLLPLAPPKKLILCSGFEIIEKKTPLTVHFSALKLYNFNFIAFHVSCNVQMPTSCHKKAKLKIIKNALPTTVQCSLKLRQVKANCH